MLKTQKIFKYLLYGLSFIFAFFKHSFLSFLICIIIYNFLDNPKEDEYKDNIGAIRQCYILISVVSFVFGNSFMINSFGDLFNYVFMYISFVIIEIIYFKTIKIKKVTTDKHGKLICYFIHENNMINFVLYEIIFFLCNIAFFMILLRTTNLADVFLIGDDISYCGYLIVWLIFDIFIGGIFAMILYKIIIHTYNINVDLFKRIIIPLIFLPINFYIIPIGAFMFMLGI